MRILGARIFLSLLAGKFLKFEQHLPWKNIVHANYFNKLSKTSFQYLLKNWLKETY